MVATRVSHVLLLLVIKAVATLAEAEADAFQVAPIYSDTGVNEGEVASPVDEEASQFVEIQPKTSTLADPAPTDPLPDPTLSPSDRQVPTDEEYEIDEEYGEDQDLADEEEEEDVHDGEASAEKTTSRPAVQPRFSQRTSALSSFKERLKERFHKKREEEKSRGSSAASRSFKPREGKSRFGSSSSRRFSDTEEEATTTETATRGRVFKSRFNSRTKGRYSQTEDRSDVSETEGGDEVNDGEEDVGVEQESQREGFGRSSSGFSRRRQAANNRRSSSSSFSSRHRGRESSFKLSAPKLSFGSRDRFSSNRDSRPATSSTADSDDVEDNKPAKEAIKPTSTQSSSGHPKIQFKKFNQYDRPDLRKTLFSKFLKKRPFSEGNIDPTAVPDEDDDENATEDGDEVDNSFPDDHESSPSALVPSIIDDEDLLQNIDNEDIRLERLQTTLSVSTVYPEPNGDEYLEVATIRSPYTFEIENNQKSTRFITVTRTMSKSEEDDNDIAPSSKDLAIDITPSPSLSSSKRPLFDTKSIPAPENILATTTPAYEQIIQGSSNIETLPPIILPSSLYDATPPLKTVTETFSTEETMVKRSILPIVVGSETSYRTLSQSYTVTRHVTATKTIPPMELYEFSPDQSFTDFDALFEGAGSENRETLLPGELEFSDQDNFGLEGNTPVRVTPPPGFLDELDLIGAKQDFINHMEKNNNPEILQLKNQNTPKLESSFDDEAFAGQPFSQIAPTKTLATPSLQNFNGLGITPEQLLYLQLLQNPLAAFGLSGGIRPQVVTQSVPVIKTETVYETNTLKIELGGKEIYTTLTAAVGVTTVTQYDLTTQTVTAPSVGLGGLPGLAGLAGLSGLTGPGAAAGGITQQQAPTPGSPLGGLFGSPAFTVVSSPVVRNTVQTETFTQEIKLTFRNIPTVTTITSTSLVSTQVTSYVTKTQKVLPTVNPLAGLLG